MAIIKLFDAREATKKWVNLMNFPNYLQNEKASLPSVKQIALKSGFSGQTYSLQRAERIFQEVFIQHINYASRQ